MNLPLVEGTVECGNRGPRREAPDCLDERIDQRYSIVRRAIGLPQRRPVHDAARIGSARTPSSGVTESCRMCRDVHVNDFAIRQGPDPAQVELGGARQSPTDPDSRLNVVIEFGQAVVPASQSDEVAAVHGGGDPANCHPGSEKLSARRGRGGMHVGEGRVTVGCSGPDDRDRWMRDPVRNSGGIDESRAKCVDRGIQPELRTWAASRTGREAGGASWAPPASPAPPAPAQPGNSSPTGPVVHSRMKHVLRGR